MTLFALLLLTAQVARTPAPVAPPHPPDQAHHPRENPACSGVRVYAPGLKTQPRNQSYSSRQILDLQFQACLRHDLQGDHLMQFKVLTPGGFLYQVLTVPFVGTERERDGGNHGEHGRSGAVHKAPAQPPPRAVPGFPKPLPVQRLVPVTGDSEASVHYSVSATLPVAGTSITLSSLYGSWTVQAYMDGQPVPCGPATRFTIRD
jgi:hypothetical protein